MNFHHIVFSLLGETRKMTFFLLLFGIITFNAVLSHESDSAEANRIEVAPFFDTIIFSDVADLINEFEKNVNTPLETLVNSESESEENIEDLLSEYQHYLDKAHKQRLSYLEKSRGETSSKNKVPVIRHERFSKRTPAMGVKYDDYYYTNGYFNVNRVPQKSLNNPLDLLIFPLNSKVSYFNKPELTTTPTQGNHEVLPNNEKKLIGLSPTIPNINYESVKAHCFCKIGQIPCTCNCEQCFIPLESMPQQHTKLVTSDIDALFASQNSDYLADNRLREQSDSDLNIKIKVDIQLPKLQDIIKLLKNRSRDEDLYSKESNASTRINYFPDPYSPMDYGFGYKRPSTFNNHDSAPLHKITIHKKKKSRYGNSNKKHRKKVITFHNINIEPQQPMKYQPNYENYTVNENVQKAYNSNETVNTSTVSSVTQKSENNFKLSSIANKPNEQVGMNETQTEQSILLMVNISNTNDNGTEDTRKIENSVESVYTKLDPNVPMEKLSSLRTKRETSTQSTSVTNKTNLNLDEEKIKNNDARKADKGLVTDAELLEKEKINNDVKKVEKGLAADAGLPDKEKIKNNDARKADKGLVTDAELLEKEKINNDVKKVEKGLAADAGLPDKEKIKNNDARKADKGLVTDAELPEKEKINNDVKKVDKGLVADAELPDKDKIKNNDVKKADKSLVADADIPDKEKNKNNDLKRADKGLVADAELPDKDNMKNTDVKKADIRSLVTDAEIPDKIKNNDLKRAYKGLVTKAELPPKDKLKNYDLKRADKNLVADAELLHWPDNFKNQSNVTTNNITTIILDRENKKVKLNMTKESIRNNRTIALEKAVFGDVNWDDVDTVAPVFMSFVGKYLRGALTFCSQNICHSMKCSEKTCVHRTCVPDERWNHRGHCAGSNKTDSVASLESIMDLPSNIAFEIVDILQDRMLGKLFGKVTLCISSKCISFVASKKNFIKSKCTSKDLCKMGHCPNIVKLQSNVSNSQIM